jgi:hypothetical protein
MTLQEIIDYVSDEFGQYVDTINPGDPERSVRDAVRKWNKHEGIVKKIEKPYSEVIDLSGMNETPKTVYRVVPDEATLLNLVTGRFGSKAQKLNLRTVLGSNSLTGSIDAQNMTINFIQRRDLWEQMSAFFGDEPTFKLHKKKLYLDNYPSDTTNVTIHLTVKIPWDGKSYEIESESAVDWIIDYGIAGLEKRQGRMFTYDNDDDIGGSDMKSSGRERMKNLEQELDDGRKLII